MIEIFLYHDGLTWSIWKWFSACRCLSWYYPATWWPSCSQ